MSNIDGPTALGDALEAIVAQVVDQRLQALLPATVNPYVDARLVVLLRQGADSLAADQPPPSSSPAVKAVIYFKGEPMPASITVDETGAASLTWVDDKGDTDAAEPAGAQVTWSVDNTSILTIDPSSGAITPVAEGDATITAALSGSDGNPLLEADGVTPFANPTAQVTVSAGAAVAADLSVAVTGAPTTPAAPAAPAAPTDPAAPATPDGGGTAGVA